jgi:hypothetical protein
LSKFRDRVNRIYDSGVAISVAAYTYNIYAIPVSSYVAQLVPLPPEALKIERAALHKVMHIATNAIPLKDFYNLGRCGGPKFRSLCATAAAAMFRTAAQTITHWPEFKRQIIEAATAFLPIELWGSGTFSPDFWDSTPIALNLDHAFRCFPGDPLWSHGTRLAVQEIVPSPSPPSFSDVLPRPPTEQVSQGPFRHPPLLPASFPPYPPIQNKIYQSLMTHAFPYNLENTIFARITDLFKPYQIDRVGLEIHSAFAILMKIRKHDAMRILKTWVNSWATSHRYHESIRHGCLFGCDDAKDSMNHYVMCPILYGLTVQLCPATSSCPLKRIGLIDPTRDSVLRVACAFAGYHAIKRACRKLDIRSETLTLEQRFAAHQLYADFFWTEAVDNGLSCKHFRPDVQSSTSLDWSSFIQDVGIPVPTGASSARAVGTEIRFVVGRDFQWQHEGLATGK